MRISPGEGRGGGGGGGMGDSHINMTGLLLGNFRKNTLKGIGVAQMDFYP